MMEEETGDYLNEVSLADTDVAYELTTKEETALDSSETLCDTSSTSVIGEVTGKLEEEDLMDNVVLLTSSSKTTPLHTSVQKEVELTTPERSQHLDSLLPSTGDIESDIFSMDNINLSESHSSYSDLGLGLNANDGYCDQSNASLGQEIVESVTPLDENSLTVEPPDVSTKDETKVLETKEDNDKEEKKADNSTQEVFKAETKTPTTTDVGEYFKGLAVDDPFDFSNDSMKEAVPTKFTVQKNDTDHCVQDNFSKENVTKAVIEDVRCATNESISKANLPSMISQNGQEVVGGASYASQDAHSGLSNHQSPASYPTIPATVTHQGYGQQAVIPSTPQDFHNSVTPAATAAVNPSTFNQGVAVGWGGLSQSTFQEMAIPKAMENTHNNIFPGLAASTDHIAQNTSPAGQTTGKENMSSIGRSMLSQNIEQASTHTVPPHENASSFQGFVPDGSTQANHVPMYPAHPMVGQPAGHVSDQFQQHPNFQQHNSGHTTPVGQSVPLFVPSVYNYSARLMYQPQIFTPAPQDFSSHMTYSSSPSKQHEQDLKTGDSEGLWSWVKNTVNTDWAEGAQKIGQKLINKTKNATDTVLTTLDPGMEEYLNPVTNIAVASNDEDILQGVRQGFRNIFGRAAVKGEYVHHFQAPLPVGFPSGIAAVCDKLNELEKVAINFKGDYILFAAEVFLTELEQQRWNAMFCLGLRDCHHRIELRTFSQPIPLSLDCVNVAYHKSSQQHLQTGYGISIGDAVRLVKPNSGKDWCYTLSGVSLQTLIVVASQLLAADYKRHLETVSSAHSHVQLQF